MSTNNTLGWVPQTDGRGTLDILWSCCFTIILCCWTSVCVNIPAPTDTYWDRLRDKFSLFNLGIIGPDFLFVLALGQWESARCSVKSFHAAGYKQWTMKHAFFADMGGFVLETPDWPPLPLDAEQLFYLVNKGYLPCPTIDQSVIDDKNKSDGLARLITVWQVLFFSITCIARAAQNLAITTIEITTLAFVFAMLCTSICWRYKPQDISRPLTLTTEITIDEILLKAQDFRKSRRIDKTNPLSILSHARKPWFVSSFWAYFTTIFHKTIRIDLLTRPLANNQPINRIPSDDFPLLSMPIEWLCGVFIILYSGIIVVGWNMPFPSRVEHLTWIVASLFMLGFSSFGGLFFFWCDYSYFRKLGDRFGRQEVERAMRSRDGVPGSEGDLERLTAAAGENGVTDRVKEEIPRIPLWMLISTSVLAFGYTLARAYILIEDVIGLRSLPASAFATVDWSQYLPHL